MYESKRIAYFLGKYPVNSENFIYREMRGLSELGAEIFILSLRRGDSIGNIFAADKKRIFYLFPDNIHLIIPLNIYFLFRHPVSYLRIIFTIIKEIKNHRISEIVKQLAILIATPVFINYVKRNNIKRIHSHFTNGSSVALFSHLLTKIKYSFTLHAYDDLYTSAILLHEKIKYATSVICESKYNEAYVNNRIEEKYHSKANVVYAGIKLPSSGLMRKIQEPLKILSVGRLVRQKGFKTLLNSLRILSERKIHYEAIIIGSGLLRDELAKTISVNKLDEHVSLVEAASYSRIEEEFVNANLFILPCEIEYNGVRDGLPNVLIEAMSFKLPVISTYVSAIPELVKNNYNGLLVNEQDVSALTDAIEYLVQHPDKALRMGENGYRTIKEHFNIGKTSSKLFELIFQN